MKVKTNDAVIVANLGIPSYPGATIIKQDKDNGAADIDMTVGDFHLRVKAVSYHTSDSPDKVLAFYRKGLARYGDVLECKGKVAVGKPTKTSDGLTCEESGDEHVSGNEISGNADIELKAGGKIHQHIVAVEKQSDGTKFGLIELDLPKGDKSESN